MNMTHTLALSGCDLRFRDSGETGLPVVFTHGAGVDARMFDQQVDAVVRAGFRAVSWDLRGHGESRPDRAGFTAERALADLTALIDHLDLDRPVLVGHSLGGNLSQAAVRRAPERFAGLVVIDSTWNSGPLRAGERALLRLAAPMLRLIPARSLPRLMADASAETPAARSYAAEAFARIGKAEFVQVWRATASLVDPDPGYRIPLPLCLIRGERDRTGNIATAMRRWAEAEGVADHVIPDAGHLAPLDAPDAVGAVLVDFLRGIER
ncbi:pimeloyl-ACP methyl ester carboxylesterase [Nocardia puris]|uniref:Pimeloyl-ACP methyl ester carboxylesterase n=2 Tax=Nocardia puris TaxID=208602 RepID=A0A366DRC0_9NOCA|nr:pimeloyl-ACP methyl ester carboxylesterase [Nocardia puris]